MKLRLLSVLFTFPFICFGQKSELLKIENGFEQFKYGTSPKEYGSILGYTENEIENLDVYRYEGIGYPEVFGHENPLIQCTFQGYKLNEVNLTFYSAGQDVYDDLVKNIEAKYGPSFRGSVLLPPGETAHRYWSSEHCNLGIYLYQDDMVLVRYWYSNRIIQFQR